MNIKEFAQKLGGREYASYPQFLTSEIELAKQNGWVIVYGASDDLIEFDGAITDEAGCYEGGKIYICETGVVDYGNSHTKCIEAIWCDNDITWTYKTDIPHETFMLYEEGEKYCQAIIFDIKDIM